MEIPDLSDDSMDDPLYNPDEDVSEDEDIEAATEAALNAEAGELKEDEPKDPLKSSAAVYSTTAIFSISTKLCCYVPTAATLIPVLTTTSSTIFLCSTIIL